MSRLLFCFGPGGAGKTSVSAAVSAALSAKGQKVCCLTIDPSKRLASALGLEAPYPLVPKPVMVRLAGQKEAVSFHALVLNSERMFLRWVKDVVPESLTNLKKNRIFQVAIESMPGLEHYVAIDVLARLYKKFDVVVVDTPPTRHAVAFLHAPEHLLTLFSNTFFTFFVRQYGGLSKSPKSLMGGLYKKGSKVLERFFGISFLTELAQFFGYFEAGLDEIRQKGKDVVQWMKQRDTSALLVGYEYMQQAEMAYYLKHIRKRGIRRCGLVYNQCLTEIELPKGQAQWITAIRHRQGIQTEALSVYGKWARKEKLAFWSLDWVQDTQVIGALGRQLLSLDNNDFLV